MQRNSNARYALLILAGMAVLIAVPILLSGLVELRQAFADRALGQHALAAQHFQRAAARLPWRSDLWEPAGVEALAAGQPAQAISLLSRAPDLSQAGWVALAQAHFQTGNLDEARRAFEAALQEGATAEIYAGLSEIHRRQGDREAELAALRNLLLFQPSNAPAHYRLGLLLSLTDINLSLTHLELASHLDESYRPVFESLRSALVLAELKPSQAERFITVGRALGLVEEWELAARAFDQAVQADEESGQAWAWRGEARWHLGQEEEAAADMERALELEPGSVIVRGLRGLYFQRLGDGRRAIEEFEAAAASDPENPAWMVSLGEARARFGDLVAALADYERAAQVNPQNPAYWRLLATFCADYNIHIEDIGLPAAQKAVELRPDDVASRELLGWLQLGAGQPLTARQTLLSVLEEQPDFALAHYHLALAYLQTGDRESARHHLELAIQFDPEGPTGEQAAEVMEQQFP